MSSSSSLSECVGGAVKLNTDYYLPLVGLGTYKITGQAVVTAAVDAALSAGYRLFDTAKYYANEAELGNALHELLPKYELKREDIFLTTKFFPSESNNAAYTRSMVEESLKCLQTDYIDLVFVHYPKAEKCSNTDERNFQNRKDVYLELEKLKDEGKIRSVGVSNFESKHIKEIESYGKVMPAVNQVEFHPLFTRDELRNYCKNQDIFFQAFSSLARNHADLMEDPIIINIAAAHKSTPQLVVLAWALGIGVGIIPKSSTPERIISNFEVCNLKLSEEEIWSISKLNRDKNYIRCDGWNVS